MAFMPTKVRMWNLYVILLSIQFVQKLASIKREMMKLCQCLFLGCLRLFETDIKKLDFAQQHDFRHKMCAWMTCLWLFRWWWGRSDKNNIMFMFSKNGQISLLKEHQVVSVLLSSSKMHLKDGWCKSLINTLPNNSFHRCKTNSLHGFQSFKFNLEI